MGIIGIYSVWYSDSRSVSQNQIRQGEHYIQFSGLFSQTFVPGFSVPEQSFDYPKYVLLTDDFAGGNYEGIKTMHVADFLLSGEY